MTCGSTRSTSTPRTIPPTCRSRTPDGIVVVGFYQLVGDFDRDVRVTPADRDDLPRCCGTRPGVRLHDACDEFDGDDSQPPGRRGRGPAVRPHDLSPPTGPRPHDLPSPPRPGSGTRPAPEENPTAHEAGHGDSQKAAQTLLPMPILAHTGRFAKPLRRLRENARKWGSDN